MNRKSYGYAVFPTVNLLSAGLQAGAKAYSEIIFFEDKRAPQRFGRLRGRFLRRRESNYGDYSG